MLKTSVGELPFIASFPSDGTPGVIVNGTERVPIEPAWSGHELTVDFPFYRSSLIGRRSEKGTITGIFSGTPLDFEVPFEAHPVEGPKAARFSASKGRRPGASIAGTWKIDFETSGLARGDFVQDEEGRVDASIWVTSIADFGALEGSVIGDEVHLSRFDGAHAFIVQARIQGDGTLVGDWRLPTGIRETFTAERAEEVEIDALSQVSLKPGYTTLDRPELRDARYQGKAVLIELFGSWCPACLEATPVLKELHQRHHDAGLEILMLAYELTRDEASARETIDLYKRKYLIPWEVVPVLGEMEDLRELFPAELEGIAGLPIFVFIDRRGMVRAIHAGFAGPGTGAQHEKQKKLLESLVLDALESRDAGP